MVDGSRSEVTTSGSNVSTPPPRRSRPSTYPQKALRGGYQRFVLGAIGSFLSTFGENRPCFLKNLSKLTFEYPHEGPWVVRSVIRVTQTHNPLYTYTENTCINCILMYYVPLQDPYIFGKIAANHAPSDCFAMNAASLVLPFTLRAM